MSDSLKDFPITGEACCMVLCKGAELTEMWILKDIETLSDGDAWELGRLWKETREKSVEISTKDLCEALKGASQVVHLDMASIKTPTKELFIEDGELIARHLI